ncbi:MAG: carbonic anhydrase family protein [Gammaproteobacteria bacterium]
MKRIIHQFCFASLTIFSMMNAHAATIDAGVKTNWTYKGNLGPERWAQLNPAFALCAAGKEQSPIDIPQKTKKSDYQLAVNYQNAPLVVMNDGETSLNLGADQLIINDGHSIQLNFPQNPSVEKVTFNGIEYQLLQFHFHSPSENLWHGQNYPLEIHFVNQGPAGKAIVLAVFVKSGETNPTLQKIIENLPKEHGKEFAIEGQTVNPGNLLPDNKGYYHFEGSLTTPPCSEGFDWVIMSTSITASPAQILQIRQAMGGSNARPTQPLHKRIISNSQED